MTPPAADPPRPERTNDFRPDIQGLRGLAVLLVVLFHAGVPFTPGGFVGVDVFFVISGFLITGLLMREVERSGHIRYLDFIARRARRLLPAALVVIAFVGAVSVLVYPPLERLDVMSGRTVAQPLYVANLWFAIRTVDYFGGAAASNPLLHMWSLAVEEQFYLGWPAFLALAAFWLKRGDLRSRVTWAVAVLSAVTFAACVWMTWFAQPWAFFGTPFTGLGVRPRGPGLSAGTAHQPAAQVGAGLVRPRRTRARSRHGPCASTTRRRSPARSRCCRPPARR